MLDGNIIEYFFAVAKLSTHYWPHPDEQNQALQEWTKWPVLQVFLMKEQYSFFFLTVLLFICAYKTWVISPPCPSPSLPIHSAPPSPQEHYS
jgi:hypothetical protein